MKEWMDEKSTEKAGMSNVRNKSKNMSIIRQENCSFGEKEFFIDMMINDVINWFI